MAVRVCGAVITHRRQCLQLKKKASVNDRPTLLTLPAAPMSSANMTLMLTRAMKRGQLNVSAM